MKSPRVKPFPEPDPVAYDGALETSSKSEISSFRWYYNFSNVNILNHLPILVFSILTRCFFWFIFLSSFMYEYQTNKKKRDKSID